MFSGVRAKNLQVSSKSQCREVGREKGSVLRHQFWIAP